jgi:hypothetical protein
MNQSAAADHANDAPRVDEARWAAAKSTYRYLRLSIVVVTVTLSISLAEQIIKHHCAQGSVSAFYYTPVHSVFIAALALVGVALIAIRGATPFREALLNMAGFLAPVVAFIPTSRPGDADEKRCVLDAAIGKIPHAFTDNNQRAFLLGGVVAMLAVLIPVFARGDRRVVRQVLLRPDIALPVVGAALVLAGLGLWRWQWPVSFAAHAHSYSAIVMFVFAGWFVAITAFRSVGLLKVVYGASAGLMIVGFLYGYVARRGHFTVLVVEIIETAAFLVFWLVQSIELWEIGVAVDKYATPST